MKEYLNGIQHIGLPVKSAKEAKDFYETLGFTLDYYTPQTNGKDCFFMKLDNLVMEIYDFDNPAGVSGSIDHLSIDCTDIEAVYDECQKLGYGIETNGIEALPYWNGVRFFKIKGPAGEMIEFCQKL